jgi:hypothetical protein
MALIRMESGCWAQDWIQMELGWLEKERGVVVAVLHCQPYSYIGAQKLVED